MQSLHELAWEHLTLLSDDALARIGKQLLCALGRHQPLLSHWRRAATLLDTQVPPLHACFTLYRQAPSHSLLSNHLCQQVCTCLQASVPAEQGWQHDWLKEDEKELVQRDGVLHVRWIAEEGEDDASACPLAQLPAPALTACMALIASHITMVQRHGLLSETLPWQGDFESRVRARLLRIVSESEAPEPLQIPEGLERLAESTGRVSLCLSEVRDIT